MGTPIQMGPQQPVYGSVAVQFQQSYQPGMLGGSPQEAMPQASAHFTIGNISGANFGKMFRILQKLDLNGGG